MWGDGWTLEDLVRVTLGYASLILAIDLDPRVMERAERVQRSRVHQLVTYRDDRQWRFSVDRWTRFDRLYARDVEIPLGRRIRDREGFLLLAGVWWWYGQTVYKTKDRELARGDIARMWHSARRKLPVVTSWPLPPLDKDAKQEQEESMRVLVGRYIGKVEQELWPVLGLKASEVSSGR
jgi:hypothetical protein